GFASTSASAAAAAPAVGAAGGEVGEIEGDVVRGRVSIAPGRKIKNGLVPTLKDMVAGVCRVAPAVRGIGRTAVNRIRQGVVEEHLGGELVGAGRRRRSNLDVDVDRAPVVPAWIDR